MATKLVRKPTTTKTSVGKETVNQTVARAKAMLGSAYDPNTKAPSASRMKEISEQSFIKPEVKKAYDKSVSAMALANTDSPVLPVQEYGKDTGPINLAGSPVLSENGISVQDNQYVYDPKVSENMNAVNETAFSNQALLDSYMGKVNDAYDQTRNQEADYLKREKQAGIQKFQQQVNDYTSEINSIVKNRDAAILSMEGQGRGQTTGFIGGEQARINREAAIAALPVQAQLDAAQGNLTSATARLDKLFAIHQQDIQNEFNFKTSLAKSVLDFGTAAQQNILTAKMADIKEASDQSQANLAYQRQLQGMAMEYGQTGLITGISAIDPKSPTFEQDIAAFTSKLRKPVAAGAPKAPTTQNVKRADGTEVTMQYNYDTGEWEDISGTGASGQVDAQKIMESTSKLDNLLRYTADAKSLSGAAGLGLYNRAANFLTGDSNYNRLANTIDTLKVNLLTMNTDPMIKKFFGPQMSNRDTELMTSAGTTLNAERQSTADMNTELNAYEDVIKRAKGWVMLGQGGTLTVQITDPQTGVKEYVPVNYDTLSQAVRDGALIKF